MSSSPALSEAKRNAMVACVEREIRMRERVYPDWVAMKKMSAGKAAHELATMREVLSVIAALPVEPPTQGGLFDAPPLAGTAEGREER